jgi:hypothetical protein
LRGNLRIRSCGDDVRVFALIGALLVAGGFFLLVDGGLRLQRALESDVFSFRIWTTEFWLFDPIRPQAVVGANAQWFLRLAGVLPASILGMKLVRVATR